MKLYIIEISGENFATYVRLARKVLIHLIRMESCYFTRYINPELNEYLIRIGFKNHSKKSIKQFKTTFDDYSIKEWDGTETEDLRKECLKFVAFDSYKHLIFTMIDNPELFDIRHFNKTTHIDDLNETELTNLFHHIMNNLGIKMEIERKIIIENKEQEINTGNKCVCKK